ncbi:MAG: hypothetical protein II806_05830 [Bacteroidaceae bacterium]|nr:hypothetical protein [Bacteroidaceae bacterium]
MGAIVGWCDSKTNITVSDCFELGTYTNFDNAGMNYEHSAGSDDVTPKSWTIN